MSPRTKEQFQEIRTISSKKILSAALKLFGNNGYESTSMSKVAKEAGVSKGLIYNYFDSKEALLKALIYNFEQEESSMMKKVFDDNPHIMLQKLIHVFFEEMEVNFESYRLISSLTMQINKFDFIHQMAVDKMKSYLVIFEELLAKTGHSNPAGEAKLFAALLDGIGFQYLMLEDDYPANEMKKYMIDKYCG